MKKINKQELHTIFTGIINGDDTKFKELYEKYYPLVEAISFSILKNKEISQDIAQEVFTKIFGLPKNQLPINNEAAWLYKVTKNEALTYLRKQKNTTNLDELYTISKEDEYLNDLISRDSYNRIIKKLNNIEQEIVSLKIMADLSFREIANILGKPTGTIQWRYYKAIHLLRTILSNMVIFIITTSLYITRRFNTNKDIQNEISNTTQAEQTKKPESEEQREEANKKEEIDAASLKNQISDNTNNSEKTNTVTNVIQNSETIIRRTCKI